MILTALRSTGQVNCRILFYWNLSDGFLMIRIGWFILGRKIIEIRCHSHHMSPRLYTIKRICHRGCHPWSHGWGSVCLISPLRSCTMSLSTLYVFCGGSHHIEPRLKKSRSDAPSPWEQHIYISYFSENFQRIFLSIYSNLFI